MNQETSVRTALMLAAAAVICFVLVREYSSRPIEIYYVAGPTAVESASPAEEVAQESQDAQELLPAGSININTASEEELCKLPGVGPVTARWIIQYREENGGFYDIEELTQVPGIGEKTLARLAPYITVT